MSDRPKRITLGVNNRNSLRVGGARVGDAARPTSDGATEPDRRAAGALGLAARPFGLRAHRTQLVAPIHVTDRDPDDEVA